MRYTVHVAGRAAPAGRMLRDKAHTASSVSFICCLQMMTSVLIMLRPS